MAFARFSPLLFALLASGAALGWQHAWADELPKDTNTIVSLTPDEARKLA